MEKPEEFENNMSNTILDSKDDQLDTGNLNIEQPE